MHRLSSNPTEGQVIGADFRVLRLLGEGGMGAVYVAEQISTGAMRAVKVMQPSVVAQANMRERFIQEARVGARIQSDHVVQVVAAGVDQATGTPWLAMELLEGKELAKHIEARGPLPFGEAREIFAQLCHAVGAAHVAGVVHRDLKPENIFLARSRTQGQTFTVKVLDFGIAKILDLARSRTTGAMGTQLWMSPEQTQASDRVSPVTDVWALGLIAFYMLTGRYYWLSASAESNTSAVLRDLLFEPLAPASLRASELGVSALPSGFDAWFARCVNRDTSARFPTANECGMALLPILQAARTSSASLAGTLPLPDHQRASFAAAQRESRPSVPSTPPPATTPSGPPPPLTERNPSGEFGQTQLGSGMGFGSYRPPPQVVPVLTRHNSSRPLPRAPAKRAQRRSPVAWMVGLALAVAALTGVLLATGVLDQGKRSPRTSNAARSARPVDTRPPAQQCVAAFQSADAPGSEAITACQASCDSTPGPACRYLADLQGRDDQADPAQARALYARACQAGDEHGCQRELLSAQRADSLDALLAQQKKLCDAGRPAGCTRAGDVHERRKDRNEAAQGGELYERGCKGGDPLGCASWAMMLHSGRRVKRAPESAAAPFARAAVALEPACTEGRGLECVALGWMKEHGLGTGKDAVGAIALYDRACSANVAEGCTNLAAMLALGRGVERDSRRADQLFRRACGAGEPTACNNLGAVLSKVPITLRTNPRAVTVFKLGCDHVLSVGCSGWGETYEAEPEVLSYEQAQLFFKQACDAGEQHGCVNLGGLVRSGRGGEIDAPRAHQLFASACQTGNAGACGEYGTMLWDGQGAPRDREQAKRFLRQACDWGELDSCSVVNSLLLRHGSRSDAVSGALELERLCSAGVGPGCYGLASAHANGQGVARDESRAFELQRRTCDGKPGQKAYPDACVDVALRHSTGRGVARDPGRGLDMLKGYCDAGQKSACLEHAVLLVHGKDIPLDPTAGASTLDALCKEGAPSACMWLGYSLRSGKVGPDDARAFYVLSRGCALGSGTACAFLAEMHEAGKGGAALDRDKARRLFAHACQSGVEWACKRAQ